MAFTLFISDLHLQEETPHTTAAFLHFLQQKAHEADALYILGDCFEVWIGDDDQSPFNQRIANAIYSLVLTGTPVYFIHGNRDFLISHRFAQESGMVLLADPTVIALYGKLALLTHGDLLCTLDHKHQAFRKKANWPWLRNLFLSLPLVLRRYIAEKIRDKSRQKNQLATLNIMDVVADDVVRVMQLHHVSLLIHGHTHRPAIHDVPSHDVTGKRIVLGAWHEGANALVYHDNGQYQFMNF